MSEAAIIGIDVGGSKTRGLVLADGEKIAARETATETSSGDAVLRGIMQCFRELEDEALRAGARVVALGVGVAGYIDFAAGTVTESPNLPLRDLPLREILQEETGLAVALDNDANAAALAENRLGAGRGCLHQLHLTLGTGIGGGIIIDGRLYRGASGAAAELGHIIVMEGGPRTACGHSGCLEALASGLAVEREARLRLEDGWRPVGMGEGERSRLSAREVAEVARAGDRTALEIWEEVGRFLGVGVASLINAFNPQAVTFSGGMTGAWEFFSRALLESVECYAIPLARRASRIEPTALGEKCGALGAALLAEEVTRSD